jgi:hypothetical protein
MKRTSRQPLCSVVRVWGAAEQKTCLRIHVTRLSASSALLKGRNWGTRQIRVILYVKRRSQWSPGATFGVGICRAQPVQTGPSALTDSAKLLLLERNDGELRMRRKRDNVIPASTSISKFMLKVTPKNNGSRHLCWGRRTFPWGRHTVAQAPWAGRDSPDPNGNCSCVAGRPRAGSTCRRAGVNSLADMGELEEHWQRTDQPCVPVFPLRDSTIPCAA